MYYKAPPVRAKFLRLDGIYRKPKQVSLTPPNLTFIPVPYPGISYYEIYKGE